jgi:hypothetical protein
MPLAGRAGYADTIIAAITLLPLPPPSFHAAISPLSLR